MTASFVNLFRGVSWTTGAFVASQGIRFGANIILTRLLAPELFGLITIVNSVRNGIDLLSDVGIFQNVVASKDAEKPEFYNTAWTLQVVRGVVLWIVSVIVAIPVALYYDSPTLAWVLPVATLPLIIAGFGSIGRFIAQKRVQYKRINMYELGVEFVGSATNILVALVSPTIWALVVGGIVASVARTIASYFLVPEIVHRFAFSKRYVLQILSFGKWIFLASALFFLSANADALFLGKVASLEIVGVYGIARTLSGQAGMLVGRVNYLLVFPLISAAAARPREDLRREVRAVRLLFVIAVAFALSVLAAFGDVVVGFLYDPRYAAAGWMLPILIVAAWFAILGGINESMLLGFSKPAYVPLALAVKMSVLLVGLPVGFAWYGVVGAVMVVALSEAIRYFPILIGQVRERFTFILQDLVATLILFSLIGAWELGRRVIGLGPSLYLGLQ